eukprot:5036819-Amphidinium_carterae.1
MLVARSTGEMHSAARTDPQQQPATEAASSAAMNRMLLLRTIEGVHCLTLGVRHSVPPLGMDS